MVGFLISIGIITFYLTSDISYLYSNMHRLNARGRVETLFRTLKIALDNPYVLRNTVRQNAELFSCLTDPTYDCPLGQRDLIVFGPDVTKWIVNPLPLGSTGKYFGFSLSPTSACSAAECGSNLLSSTSCDTFQTTGDEFCYLRARSFWYSDCTASPCYSPSLRIQIELQSVSLDRTERLLGDISRFTLSRML